MSDSDDLILQIVFVILNVIYICLNETMDMNIFKLMDIKKVLNESEFVLFIFFLLLLLQSKK